MFPYVTHDDSESSHDSVQDRNIASSDGTACLLFMRPLCSCETSARMSRDSSMTT